MVRQLPVTNIAGETAYIISQNLIYAHGYPSILKWRSLLLRPRIL